MQLGLAMKARVLLTTLTVGLLVALVLDLLVLSPLRGVGSLEEFYGPLDSGRRSSIAILVSAWVAISGVVIAWHVYRLGSQRTWSWNYAFSPWRTTRSLFFVVGIVCIGSAVPGVILSAVPVVTDSSERTDRLWDLLGLVLGVGGLAMSAAIVMYLVGVVMVVVREVREHKNLS